MIIICECLAGTNDSRIPNIYDEIHESLNDHFQDRMFVDLDLDMNDLYTIKKYILPEKISRKHYNDIMNDKNSLYHSVLTSNRSNNMVKVNKVILKYKNRLIKVSSMRTVLINQSDFKCSVCGSPITEGKLFCFKDNYPEDVDRSALIWSVAYIVTLNGGGKRIMTKDHFIPKAKHGANNIRNMIPMCSLCNNRKADYDLIMRVKDNPYIDYQDTIK